MGQVLPECRGSWTINAQRRPGALVEHPVRRELTVLSGRFQQMIRPLRQHQTRGLLQIRSHASRGKHEPVSIVSSLDCEIDF